MRKAISRLTIVVLLLMSVGLLQGCFGSGPVMVAKKFTEALSQGKLEEAKSYATEQTAQMIDMASSMGGLPIQPNYRFKLVSKEINENEATIKYIDGHGAEAEVHLAKIDGRWKVHESK